MESRRDHFSRLIAREGGKPLTDAIVETTRAIDSVRNAADELRSFAGREIPMGLTPASTGRLAFTTREPIGVVVAVSAFDHPLNLIVRQVAPAIAVGCPVIVKPAMDAVRGPPGVRLRGRRHPFQHARDDAGKDARVPLSRFMS
jgi:acyl-CoA reductase-like NAD-dependent aldehyde dehydrogenase